MYLCFNVHEIDIIKPKTTVGVYFGANWWYRGKNPKVFWVDMKEYYLLQRNWEAREILKDYYIKEGFEKIGNKFYITFCYFDVLEFYRKNKKIFLEKLEGVVNENINRTL